MLKTVLKIFVDVIPKESLAGTSTPKPLFGMSLTVQFHLCTISSKTTECKSIVRVIRKEGLGWGHSIASLLLSYQNLTKILEPVSV